MEAVAKLLRLRNARLPGVESVTVSSPRAF